MEKPPLSVAIGLPIDCGHRHEFWLSLLGAVLHAPKLKDAETQLQFISNPGDSLVTRARNNITHNFLMDPRLGSPEYLVFIDTDIVFTPADLMRLVQHRVRGIVAGRYALKMQRHQWCANVPPEAKIQRNGLVPVLDCGTGFMCIHRDVFKAMRESMDRSHYYRCDANKDIRFSFWDAGVVNGRYLSEDWLFCHRARKLGFPVLLDTKITVGHAGWAVYPLNVPVEKKRPRKASK